MLSHNQAMISSSLRCGVQWSGGRASGFQSKGPGFEITSAVLKRGQFYSPHFVCLSEETVKAIGPFYLVSMPGEVKAIGPFYLVSMPGEVKAIGPFYLVSMPGEVKAIGPFYLVSMPGEVKAIGPFYLVSMPGEVKDPMQVNGKKPVIDLLTLEKDTLKNQKDHIENKLLWCALMCYPQYYWLPKNQQQQKLILKIANIHLKNVLDLLMFVCFVR